MYTLQTDAFERLTPHLGAEVTDMMRNIFSNCQQTLEHRGDVIFNGDVTIGEGGTIPPLGNPGIVLPPGWVDVPPYEVPIQPIDPITGEPIGEPITIIVEPEPTGDPNMQPGDIIYYIIVIQTPPGSPDPPEPITIVLTDVIDLPFGSILMLKPGTDIPGGWSVYSPMSGKFPVGAGGWAGPPGTTGGSTSHTHPDHPGSSIPAHGPAELTTGDATITVDLDVTGDLLTGPPQPVGGEPFAYVGTAGSGLQIAPHPDHTHDVSINGSNINQGDGSGGTANIAAPGDYTSEPADTAFGHVVQNDDHTHTIGNHAHVITEAQMEAVLGGSESSVHSHQVPYVLPHSGALTHEPAEHIPPYLSLLFIVRDH